MNLSLLPNLLALLVFLGAFMPLARRAGPRANDWFVAFAFIFVQQFALTFERAGGSSVAMHLVAAWAVQLAGVAFMRAATWQATDLDELTFLTVLISPILLKSYLLVTNTRPLVHVLCSLLLAAPWFYLRLRPSQRTPLRQQIALVSLAAVAMSALISANDPPTALALLNSGLFAGAAVLCWENAEQASAGMRTAVGGLLAWALTFPIESLIPPAEFGTFDSLLRVPYYVVAYGVILMLVERHVRQTEAMALHDALTGLPNRRLFDDRLEQALQSVQDSGTMLACLIIDVDRFKIINDTLGHLVGDGLLQAVATRLNWQIGIGDTLARTGGDEFSAVLTRLQSLEHLRFIVGAMMSATCVPVMVGEHELSVGLSIGIALYPTAGVTGDELRRQADDAMYEAKRSGGNQFAYVGGPPDEAAQLALQGMALEFAHVGRR